jgi:hypothetical protein
MMTRAYFLAAALLFSHASAFGQQRPLLTEDPEPIGTGRVLIEGGVDYSRDVNYPVTGLDGHLFRGPLIGVSVGLSSIAEIQIDGGFFNHLSITARNPAPLADLVTATGDGTSSVEDFVIATKIRIAQETEGRPSFGVRVATKLPNSSNESGIGLDTTDFFASVIGAKTVRSVRFVANIGLGILGNPTSGGEQNDVVTYGASFARALTDAGEIVGEVNGRISTSGDSTPIGTESRGTARFGGRYTIGSWRADAAVFFGLTSTDPSVGFTGGFTYVFDAFQIP